MRKKFFLFGLCLFASIAATVSAAVYTTTCGKRVMSVDRGYFGNDDAGYANYIRELNDIECGTTQVSHFTVDMETGDVVLW